MTTKVWAWQLTFNSFRVKLVERDQDFADSDTRKLGAKIVVLVTPSVTYSRISRNPIRLNQGYCINAPTVVSIPAFLFEITEMRPEIFEETPFWGFWGKLQNERCSEKKLSIRSSRSRDFILSAQNQLGSKIERFDRSLQEIGFFVWSNLQTNGKKSRSRTAMFCINVVDKILVEQTTNQSYT